MEEIGVQLIVEGLDSFVGSMDKAKSTLLDLIAPPSLLQDAFGSLGGALGNFASWVGDVLTYTLGGLLTDAFEAVTSAIGEMISNTIEAGKEFQTLKLRLNGLNLQSLIDSGVSYNDATKQSVELTQQQLAWLQRLAAATPYDNKDISNIYSLARGYGFADQEARDLTVDTADFASAMGLGSEHMERIIVNLGQMKARGKITGTEIRDLARGAFLPLDDVLGRVAKSMGMTTAALTKAISKPGEGVPAQKFIDAFEQMIRDEPRFQGASERMARSFGAASDNVKDLVTSFGGLNIVTPILDVLGGKIADFMDQFIRSDDAGQSYTALGQKLLDASVSIGKSLVDIINSVLGLLPSSEGIGNTLVSSIDTFAGWLKENKEGIIADVKSVFDWIMNLGQTDFFKEGGILSQLGDLWTQLTNVNTVTGQNGFQDLSDAISNLGKSIGSVLDPFLKPLGVTLEDSRPSLDGFIDGLTRFTAWIDEHQAQIQWLLGAFIAFQIIQTIANLVLTLGISLVGLLFSIGAITIVAAILLIAFFGVVGVFALFTVGLFILQTAIAIWGAVLKFNIDLVVGFFQNLIKNVLNSVHEIITAFQRGDFGGMIRGVIDLMLSGWNAGISSFVEAAAKFGGNVVGGFRDGFFNLWWTLSSDITNAFYGMIAFIKSLLGIASPSKVFAGIGTNMIAGMAQGITDATGLAVGAMEGMVAAVTMPAIAAPAVMQQYSQMAPSSISSTYQSSQTNNLNIHTSAGTEPILQDFRMMQSLTGV